jgi:glyoxylase-like metal-dependent hydrolase (beta-lactamase superfamily II)
VSDALALSIVKVILGPAQTNTYLVANEKTKEAVVIDPAWDGETILSAARKRGWQIGGIWLTHAHFDHFGGAAAVASGFNPPLPMALHPDDRELWGRQGDASRFGMQIDPGPEPTIELTDGQILHIGEIELEVRHTPGHTPGGVIYFCPSEQVAFVGDLIFQGSIGRTDFPGGDYDAVIKSIRNQVFSLPDETRLMPGHGPESTVGAERANNPFLS